MINARKDVSRGLSWRLVSCAAAVLTAGAAGRLAAQEAVQEAVTAVPLHEQPPNLVLRSVGTFLVIAVLWLIFYKVAYPFFLRYYRSDFCRTVFWTLFSLYSLTWLLLASYLVFDYGFHFFWMKWVAVFLAVLWLISGLTLMLQRRPA